MVLVRVVGPAVATALGVAGAVAGYSATADDTVTAPASSEVAGAAPAPEQAEVRVRLRDCQPRLELRAGACVRIVRRPVVTWVAAPGTSPVAPAAEPPPAAPPVPGPPAGSPDGRHPSPAPSQIGRAHV